MAKYHIIPRGEVKQCNAKVHCGTRIVE